MITHITINNKDIDKQDNIKKEVNKQFSEKKINSHLVNQILNRL